LLPFYVFGGEKTCSNFDYAGGLAMRWFYLIIIILIAASISRKRNPENNRPRRRCGSTGPIHDSLPNPMVTAILG
jgi:hypothetical protein